jgi:N-acetylglutamate synthase/N-acetylornithine aminotransferase
MTEEWQIPIDFHQPNGETATVWTCNFGCDYVKIIAECCT